MHTRPHRETCVCVYMQEGMHNIARPVLESEMQRQVATVHVCLSACQCSRQWAYHLTHMCMRHCVGGQGTSIAEFQSMSTAEGLQTVAKV